MPKSLPEVNFDDVFPELVKAAAETFEFVERTETRIKFRMKLIMSSSVEWWMCCVSNLKPSIFHSYPIKTQKWCIDRNISA